MVTDRLAWKEMGDASAGGNIGHLMTHNDDDDEAWIFRCILIHAITAKAIYMKFEINLVRDLE